MMRLKRTLLIADVQRDFCPGGSLSVKAGDKIIPAVNKYIKLFSKRKLPIFLTRDWHPAKTSHFKKFGGAWPIHCVQNTKGAQFHPKLKIPKEAVILSKGMDPDKDSYSAFQSQDSNGMELLNLLKMFGINELFVGGLATDYCVKHTALDALKYGFKVDILTDAIKGVNLRSRDSDEAIDEMVSKGAKKITLKDMALKI